MKLSFSNGTFANRPLKENLATVKALGFENVEFNMKSVETENDLSVYAAKKLVDEAGLNCLTLHAATLHVRDEVEVHRAVYYGKISAEFAHKLSAPIMVIHSNVSRKLPKEVRNRLVSRIFGEIKPYAESLGVQLALENLSYASSGFGKNVTELEEVFGNMGHAESVGITLDFCHATATGVVQSLLEKYNGRLCNIHLSNRVHKPFMEETPMLSDFVAKLRRFGYDGPVTLELSRKCTLEEIAKTKAVVENALSAR